MMGLLFDIDGTLASTDHLHHEALNEILAPFGRQVDEPFYKARVMGRTNAAIFAELFPTKSEDEQTALWMAKEAAFRARAQAGIDPMPGLMELLDWADTNTVPYACVTNAPRLNAELILTGLGLKGRFEHVVIADEIAHGKPHPLPYLIGAELINVEPNRCIAFEDSGSGVLSAAAAGTITIGMLSGLDTPALVAFGAALTVTDFRDPRIMALIARTLGPSA
jgi:HAD superfamily hydrolase (TIGR01509 family)